MTHNILAIKFKDLEGESYVRKFNFRYHTQREDVISLLSWLLYNNLSFDASKYYPTESERDALDTAHSMGQVTKTEI